MASPTPMATDNDGNSPATSTRGVGVIEEKKSSTIDLDDGEDGVLFESHGGNVADDRFDQMIGVLEDYILDSSFGALQNDFFRTHMAVFVDDEENKLEYTPIHQKYVDMLEAAFAARLTRDVPNFDMTEFLTMIEDRKEEIPGDIMDLLSSLDDFEMFKSMILSFKRENTPSSAAAPSSIAVHHFVPSTTSASASAPSAAAPSAAAPAKPATTSSSASGSMGGFGISGTSIPRASAPLARAAPSSGGTSRSSSSGGLGLDFGISGTAIRKNK